MKEIYFIDVMGCDDTTTVEMELTKKQLEVIIDLAKRTYNISDFSCQPIIEIYQEDEEENKSWISQKQY